MILDSGELDTESMRDVLVGQAVVDEANHLLFADRQARWRPRTTVGGKASHTLQQQRRLPRRAGEFAARHAPDNLDKLLEPGISRDESGNSLFDAVNHLALVVDDTKRHDAAARSDGIEPRHKRVLTNCRSFNEQNIRFSQLDMMLAVRQHRRSRTDNLDIRIVGQRLDYSIAVQANICNQKNTDATWRCGKQMAGHFTPFVQISGTPPT
jgi:hypothetical protein